MLKLESIAILNNAVLASPLLCVGFAIGMAVFNLPKSEQLVIIVAECVHPDNRMIAVGDVLEQLLSKVDD